MPTIYPLLSEIKLETFTVFGVPSDTSNIRAFKAGLSNAAPVIYFLRALIYSAGFNVNQNVKKKKSSE
jgi:hypothetical protein